MSWLECTRALAAVIGFLTMLAANRRARGAQARILFLLAISPLLSAVVALVSYFAVLLLALAGAQVPWDLPGIQAFMVSTPYLALTGTPFLLAGALLALLISLFRQKRR